MKIEDVDPIKEANGDYCQKGVPGCYCKGGRPLEKMCPVCRPLRESGEDPDFRSFCVCDPPDWLVMPKPKKRKKLRDWTPADYIEIGNTKERKKNDSTNK